MRFIITFSGLFGVIFGLLGALFSLYLNSFIPMALSGLIVSVSVLIIAGGSNK